MLSATSKKGKIISAQHRVFILNYEIEYFEIVLKPPLRRISGERRPYFIDLTNALELRALTKAAVVRETVLISLSGREAASRGAVNSYGVFFGEESCCDTGVGLGHRVAVYHSSDVAGITWDLLAAHVMGWACNPVFGEFALVSKDILIHLGTSWQIYVALHALLKSDAAHVVFVASGLANFLVDGACSFAKQVIFEGHVSCVARQILASPRALLLGAML